MRFLIASHEPHRGLAWPTRPESHAVAQLECTVVNHPMRSLLLLVLLPATAAAGPFDPAAGQPGSLAVAATDPAFVAWATGHENYLVGSDVDSSWQTPQRALGPGGFTIDPLTGQTRNPAFDIVSLGNGGSITLTFSGTIYNGPGWDFAVFENSFSDTFLELARVQVSSDGVNFSPFFPVFSCTPGPVGAFGALDPTNLFGFAGKYRAGFGAVFDLAVFSGLANVDVDAISHVRIVDVMGDGSELDNTPTGVDLCGDGITGPRPIYDPFRTVGSAGFDLDAVGVRYLNAAPEPEPEPEPVHLPVPVLAYLAFAALLIPRAVVHLRGAT
jgi:hypothetical protein